MFKTVNGSCVTAIKYRKPCITEQRLRCEVSACNRERVIDTSPFKRAHTFVGF